MHKIFIIALFSLLLYSCGTTQTEKYYSELGTTCFKSQDSEDGMIKCVKINTDKDLYKWHIVAPWQSLGDKP